MFDYKKTPAEIMDFAHELGVEYVVSSFNPPASVTAAGMSDHPDIPALIRGLERMTLEDYKKSAETANQLGTEAKKRGLQYLYHNHNVEFRKFGDITAYDLLLTSTDPDLVKLELDCGWMAAAGHDPVAYLDKYPGRYPLLHIKAFKRGKPSFNLAGPGAPIATELGKGALAYEPVFAAARRAGVKQYYVEQEPPFADMPPLKAMKVDYEFLHNLKA
jgi:sugar phosphate isomerase/epimerase